MNRREFLFRSSLLASVGLAGRSTLMGQQAPTKKTPSVTEFRSLRRNVGLFTGRGGTIGWLAAKDALVVVDTQFPDTAGICLAGLPEREKRILDAVINTHHHADHTSGNGIFKPVT